MWQGGSSRDLAEETDLTEEADRLLVPLGGAEVEWVEVAERGSRTGKGSRERGAIEGGGRNGVRGGVHHVGEVVDVPALLGLHLVGEANRGGGRGRRRANDARGRGEGVGGRRHEGEHGCVPGSDLENFVENSGNEDAREKVLSNKKIGKVADPSAPRPRMYVCRKVKNSQARTGHKW